MKPAPVAGFVRLGKNNRKINYKTFGIEYKSFVDLSNRNKRKIKLTSWQTKGLQKKK